jgi:hypothetical protein
LYDEDAYFIQIDFKKCGWSFPKICIERLIELLYNKYNFQVFGDYLNAFKTIYFSYKGDTPKKVTRGYVLGMNDHLLSFFLSNLLELIIQKDDKINLLYEQKKLFVRFYGDDSIIKVKTDNIQDVYYIWNKVINYYNELDIIINKKKSFI